MSSSPPVEMAVSVLTIQLTDRTRDIFRCSKAQGGWSSELFES
jgi:hypothetical protein